MRKMSEEPVCTGFTDIHNHILFGVDDGSPDIKTSMEMLRMAYEDGIRDVILTPHFHPKRGMAHYSKIVEHYEILADEAAKTFPDMGVYLGREVYFRSEILDDLDKLDEKTMCGTDTILIEFSSGVEQDKVRGAVLDVIMAGYHPIVAHVERYVCTVKDWDYIYELKRMGADIQINADSVTGDNGWGFEALSKDAVQMNLFHYGAVIPWKADGDFKFTSVTDFGQSDAFFHPTEGNAPYTSTSVVLGGEDNKWQMKESECGKAYKVLFLTAKGKEKMLMRPFTPYEGLYLVGDATPNGWSIDNATPMAKSADSPYIFTWSGTLNTGEMKISCDKQSDWNGDWLMADKSGKAPTGEVETALFTSKTDAELKNMYPDTDLGSLDNKWNIQEAGSYRITIDQLKETISIVKQ